MYIIKYKGIIVEFSSSWCLVIHQLVSPNHHHFLFENIISYISWLLLSQVPQLTCKYLSYFFVILTLSMTLYCDSCKVY